MTDPQILTGALIGGSSIASILAAFKLADIMLSRSFIRRAEFCTYEKNTQQARSEITQSINILGARLNDTRDEVHQVGVHVEWLVKAIEKLQPKS